MLRRVFCLICFVLSYEAAQGQALEGTYVADLGKGSVTFESEAFQFTGNRFRYWFSSCTSGGEAGGTYTLTANTLRLRFEIPVSTKPSQQGSYGPLVNGTVYTFGLRLSQPTSFLISWPNQTYKPATPYRRATAKEVAKWGLKSE